MRHPLAVTRNPGGTNASAMDVGMVHRETGIPASPTLGVFARQIRPIFHAGAKTSGANNRAVRAGETAPRNFHPVRMFVITIQQCLYVRCVQDPAHP